MEIEQSKPAVTIPIKQEEINDFLKVFIKEAIDNPLEELYMKLRGYVRKYKVEGNRLIQKIELDENLVLCNDEGAIYILSAIDDYFNASILMANFSEDEVKTRLKQKADEIRVMIITNKNKFEIKEEHWMRVWSLVMAKIDIALHIARKGQFMKFLKTTHQIRHLETHQVQQQQERKPGLLDQLAKWGGRR